jgi:hypothetical protein
MRKLFTLTAIATIVLVAASTNARAQNYAFGYSGYTSSNDLVINGASNFNTDSGWIDDLGNHQAGNTNYYAGNNLPTGGDTDANYFSFLDIASGAHPVTSASFSVYTYGISVPGTYTLFYSTLLPATVISSNSFSNIGYYDAIVNGPVIGTIVLTPGDSDSTAVIDLNAVGDTVLSSKLGDDIVIGGTFVPTITPEPSTYLMFGTGLLGLAFLMRKKIAQQISGLSSASQMGNLA